MARALRILGQALLLVVAGTLLGLGVNAVRARRLPLRAADFDYQIRCEEASVESKARVLTVAELTTARGARDVAVVDIRDAGAYAAGHVPGARSIPTSVVAATDPAKIAPLKGLRQVIIYDESDDLVRAEDFAGELTAAKVKDVRFLGPGFKGWVAAGQPVTKGATP